ncbi:MAG: hypothetical protein KME47_19660 [Nodosilinea sp. WJT8-NPBG4]|nr:hypothetical protein [Nodosilinea sp. WJT8-NPBG4]
MPYTLTQVALVSVAAKRTSGRPKHSQPSDPVALGYQWQATLERTDEYEAQCQQRHRRFILATNVLDEDTYPAERLLREYKAQQHVEGGFRFLKDPLFFTSSVFIKKPQRVVHEMAPEGASPSPRDGLDPAGLQFGSA